MNFPVDQWIFNYYNLSLIAGPGPKYGLPRHNHHHLETSDAEAEVSCYSVTEQLLSEDPSSATSSPRTADTSAPAGYSGISGASLVFLLVYGVFFAMTLLYVGLWLTKW